MEVQKDEIEQLKAKLREADEQSARQRAEGDDVSTRSTAAPRDSATGGGCCVVM